MVGCCGLLLLQLFRFACVLMGAIVPVPFRTPVRAALGAQMMQAERRYFSQHLQLVSEVALRCRGPFP